jgi:hypothetical protein
MRIVHEPYSSREPYTVIDDLETLDEAREALRLRAAAVESRYPGTVCLIREDGLAMEVVDEDAPLVGDYQGLTYVTR